MSKKRQLHRQEEVRNKILDAGREIIKNEGIEGLSIRKIAKEIDYSPGIIYHYFNDKNAIIEYLVGEGYRKILASISAIERNENEPEKEIKEAFTNYIKTALSFPEEYKVFMLNDDPAVLQKTSLLGQGVSNRRQSLQQLTDNLLRGISKGRYAAYDPELTAQIIWTATYGLILKIIFEKDLAEEQINRLIDQHFNILFNGIMLRKDKRG